MSPAVVLRSKFVTPRSSVFNDYINYMDREDAKHNIGINYASDHENDFDVFYQFMDYMDDDTKQGELFTADQDYLNDSKKQKMKKQFQIAQQNEIVFRSEEHTSELQSRGHLVCRLLLEKKKKKLTHTR